MKEAWKAEDVQPCSYCKSGQNTSAASVPLALDVAVRDGRIQRGDMILLEAFGGGFTWGSALIKY